MSNNNNNNGDDISPIYSTVIFKVTGMLSMLATSYIMYEVLMDKKKRKRTYFRLMFGMSFIEFCDGLAFFLGSWATMDGLWAAGNNASCQFQGFLLQASIGSTFYNAFLALYYLLSIRYNWSERLIARKVEPWMHGITLSIAYGTAIACIPLDLFISLGSVCYISPYPFGCRESFQYGAADANCERGDNATLYTIFFFTIWQWLCIAFTAIAMAMIYCGVRQQENKMKQYAFGGEAAATTRKNSRRFMKQGMLYVLVFYFSHLFATIALQMIQHGNFHGYQVMNILTAITYPLEGFLNFLVYMRPRFIKYLKKRKKMQRQKTKTTAGGIPALSGNKSNHNDNEPSEGSAGGRDRGGDDNNNENNNKERTVVPEGMNTTEFLQNAPLSVELGKDEEEHEDLDAY